MNLQQLQYIIAVDQHRHFLKASEACFVTQATLSMMIKKLEEELGVTIFDRSKHPVVPTDVGSIIISKAREVIRGVQDLEQSVLVAANEIKGEIRVGIIPTLAPYLLHLFLPTFLKNYPDVTLRIKEMSTTYIVDALKHNQLDIGIVATPLKIEGIKEKVLFYEKLLVFAAGDTPTREQKQFILAEDLDIDRLWLLEEEHCLRSQIMNLCSLRKRNTENLQLEFEAGSIETLINMVEISKGITIIPELILQFFSEARKKQVRSFSHPAPVREISLITYRHFVKEKLLSALEKEIKAAVTPVLSEISGEHKIIPI